MAKKKEETEAITARLYPHQIEALKRIKGRNFISISDQLRLAVDDFIKKMLGGEYNG